MIKRGIRAKKFNFSTELHRFFISNNILHLLMKGFYEIFHFLSTWLCGRTINELSKKNGAFRGKSI